MEILELTSKTELKTVCYGTKKVLGKVSANWRKTLLDWPRSDQLVGKVMAYQKAMTGRGGESLTPNDGTETRAVHLRVAAVENIRQWAKA